MRTNNPVSALLKLEEALKVAKVVAPRESMILPTGSTILSIYGLLNRDVDDVDFIVTAKEFKNLVKDFITLCDMYPKHWRCCNDYHRDSFYYENGSTKLNFCLVSSEAFFNIDTIGTHHINTASPEHVIEWKLNTLRKKDCEDLKLMVRDIYSMHQLENARISHKTIGTINDLIFKVEIEKSITIK